MSEFFGSKIMSPLIFHAPPKVMGYTLLFPMQIAQTVSATKPGVLSSVEWNITPSGTEERDGHKPKYVQELIGNYSMAHPQALDVGIIVVDSRFQVIVFNGTKAPITINSITNTNDEDIHLVHNNQLTISEYQWRVFDLAVLAKGVQTINTEFILATTSLTHNIKIIGQRLPVIFILPINWESGITERWQYMTDILAAYDGSEQRIELRDAPRIVWEYPIIASEELEVSLLDALIWGNQGKAYLLPIWIEGEYPTAAINTGDNAINVNTTFMQFAVDDALLLYQSVDDYEIVQIANYTSNQISLRHPVQQTWGTAITVVPLKYAYIPDELSPKRLTADVTTVTIPFEVVS